MSAVVGIDLGTTNTVVAAVQGGRAMALANESNDRLIPSVVAFHPNGSVLVGREAKARRLQDSANTVYSTKRLIGRSFDSEEVRKARQRSAFEIQEGPGRGVLVVARGESYTLSEISAFVLREAKRVAEAALGEPVERAVVTVPANFNDLQRAATKVAGHIAGIEVLRILNEPTAAALAYGYGKANQERIVVYDFGGGTFDVTLLDLAGNVFEVLATAGDTFLGGDDIDIAIADRIAERFLVTHRYDPRSDRQVFEHMLKAAEEIKIGLSSAESHVVQLNEIAYGPGGKSLDMTFEMNRSELDVLLAPLVDRTLNVCSEALGVARLAPKDFDQVIIVGGSTRVPLVRKRVADFFGRRPMEHLSADEVVAMGAAIQAAALTGAERKGMRTGVSPRMRNKATDPGLGSRSGVGAGMIAAPVPSKQPITVPHAAGEEPEDDTAVMSRQPGERAAPPPPPRRAPPPPPRTRMASDPDGPTLASARDGKAGGTAPGLFPGPEPAPVPLPLIQAGPSESSTSSGLRVLDEDPTELRSATALLREASKADKAPNAPMGSTTARMGSAPSYPPVGAPAGSSTARMPSAPPLPPPGPGVTTARMPSAPPQPPPQQPRAVGPRGTVVQPEPHVPSLKIPSIGAAAAAAGGVAAGVAAGAAAAAGMRASPPTPLQAPPPPAMQPPPAPRVLAQDPSHQRREQHSSPLLLDVTPLSLAVETVRGYCDVVIERNTPVPCERTRLFATAADNQTVVRVNVAQGESRKFDENTLLGQVELSGLRAAPRGEVEIAVTFEIDSDGILDVRASDTTTGHVAKVRINLGGAVPAGADLEGMRARMERMA